MYSIGTLFAVLFAVVAATNAIQCRPVTCMIACPFGFELDAQGCPHCNCRRAHPICVEPIFGYNCGSIDHRDCPSSHECQLNFGGFSGQCCLKRGSSTTARATTATTARVNTATTARGTTRSALSRLFFVRDASAEASSTQSGTTAEQNASPASTAGNSGSTTDSWFGINFPWIGAGSK